MKKRTALCFSLLLLAIQSCSLLSPGENADQMPPSSSTEIARIVEQTLQARSAESNNALLEPATEPAAPEPSAAAEEPSAIPTRKPSPTPGQGTPSFMVAYTLEGDIFLWKPKRESQRLTNHAQALNLKLSPDGAWIAYLKQVNDRQQEIWSVRIDGSDNRALVKLENLATTNPDASLTPDQFEWLPGTHRVLYNTNQVPQSGPGSPPSNDLRIADADSGENQVLLAPGQGGHFTLSPDRHKLGLVQANKILTAEIDGSNPRQLFTFPEILTYSEWIYLPDLAWNMASTSFRVIIPPQDPMTRPDESSIIWEIPIDGSPARQLGSFLAAPAWRYRPRLSPDGFLLAYQTMPTTNTLVSDLHIASTDLSADRVSVSGQIEFDSWSPDSKRFTIQRADRAGIQMGTVSGNLYSFPVGISPYRLTWIDASQYLVLSGSRDTPELYLTDAAGRITKIAAATGPDIAFDFVK